MPETTRHRPDAANIGPIRNGPGTPRQIHRDNTKFTLVQPILSYIEKQAGYWLMAWHPAVPGHQQIPTELKYSKRKENLQIHVIFRLSTAFGYIIHDRRKPTSNSAHLQNDDVTLSHSAMKTNRVPVTINIIRGLSGANWGIQRHSDILKTAWHDIRHGTNSWNNEKYEIQVQ